MACTLEHARYCFDVLDAQLNKRALPSYDGSDAAQDFPLFVTWNTIRSSGSTRLRGCIGNFAPMPLATGLQEYALIAALKDRRFSPVALSELAKLECAVSLLTDFEDVDDPLDWTLGTHGISIHFKDPDRGRSLSATYLPDVAPEQGWSKIETLDSAMQKAGYNGEITDGIRQSVRVTRYQSSRASLTYAGWKRK